MLILSFTHDVYLCIYCIVYLCIYCIVLLTVLFALTCTEGQNVHVEQHLANDVPSLYPRYEVYMGYIVFAFSVI